MLSTVDDLRFTGDAGTWELVNRDALSILLGFLAADQARAVGPWQDFISQYRLCLSLTQLLWTAPWRVSSSGFLLETSF